jgi:hypothetical protein
VDQLDALCACMCEHMGALLGAPGILLHTVAPKLSALLARQPDSRYLCMHACARMAVLVNASACAISMFAKCIRARKHLQKRQCQSNRLLWH